MRRLLAVLVVCGACLALATAVSGGPGATYADVAPIFQSKCAGCHTVGGIAPFSLATASDARAHAQLIKAMTQAHVMPPWPPGRDSKPFVGQRNRQLTVRELDLIASWVDIFATNGRRCSLIRDADRTSVRPAKRTFFHAAELAVAAAASICD